MSWMLACILILTFVVGHPFYDCIEQTCMFVFLCPLFYLEAECSWLRLWVTYMQSRCVALCVQHVYFSIYSSIVVLRQCPTFISCFFPHFIASALIIHHTLWSEVFEIFCSATCLQYTHGVSGLIKMSFDCVVRESWHRC